MRRLICQPFPVSLLVAFLWLCKVFPGSGQPNVVAWGDSTYGRTNVPVGLSDAVAVSAGAFHCLAVRADGTVMAWGSSPGTNVPAGLANVVAVAAGQAFSLALKTDGTVIAWGSNPATSVPSGLTNVVAIAAGLNHGLALTGDGTVVAWGGGQTAVPPGLGSVVGIAAGSSHSVAVMADGSVAAWAANSSQITAPAGLSNAVAVAAGYNYSLALKADGSVAAWGATAQPPATLTNVVAMAAGSSNMVLKADGTITLWASYASRSPGLTNVVAIAAGNNSYLAVVGNGPPVLATPLANRTTRVGASVEFYALATGAWPLSYQWQFNGTDIPGATAPVLTLTNVQVGGFGTYRVVVTNALGSIAGPNATLSLLPVFAWGANTQGQTNVCGGIPTVVAIAAGYKHCLALRTNGTVVGWGWNSFGQAAVPAGLANVTAISAGYWHSLALKADGTVAAWGWSSYTNVPVGVTNVASVSAGFDHSLALRWDGTVVSWDGITGSTLFIFPSALTNVVAVAAGYGYSLALKADGTVFVRYSGSPKAAPPSGLSNAVAVAAGDQHCLALRADGTVIAWGSNSYGQTNVPADLTNVVAISAGASHSLALKADGTLIAWGSVTNVPPGLTNLVAVEAGDTYSVALAGDGPPSLARPLVNRFSFVGGTVFFYASALGAWPGSYQWQFNGVNISGASSQILSLTNVQPANAGFYTVVITNSQGAITSAPAVLRVDDFGPALNTTNLNWITFGDVLWLAETNVSHDGFAAAQSGSLSGAYSGSSESSSRLETTVNGPGTLTFWWKMTAQSSLVYLSLFVNGTSIAFLSGTTDWQQGTIYLGPGAQVLDWALRSFFYPVGLNVGWVDEVSFSPGATLPRLTSGPLSQSQAAGADVTFAVAATGTPPFGYQWLYNGTNLPGATASSLTVTNVQAPNAGDYSVLVSNPAGSILSTNAELILGRIAAWGMSLPPTITNAVALAGGLYHALALQPDATVLAWGTGGNGQIDVPLDLTNVMAIAGGGWFSLALRADGTVAAWGDNSSGQTNVPAGLTNVIAIAGGLHHALALKGDGTVAAWGDNAYGELDIPGGVTNVVALAAGFGYSLALKADGTVTAWGNNDEGQTNVPAGLTNVVAIAAGLDHCVGLEADGKLVVWGNPNYGLTNVPAGLTNPVAIAAGAYMRMALQANGTVTAWGWNQSGDTSVPAGLRNVVEVASGGYHGLALQGTGPPALTTPLANPVLSSNGFSVLAPTRSGRVYRLEYSVSLNNTGWIALPLVPGTGCARTLTDPAPTDAQRFYRVRQW